MNFITGTSGASITLVGTIGSTDVLTGSKSAHVGPVLSADADRHYRLYVIGDNPFENSGLSDLQGKRVRLTGVWRNGVVRVAQADMRVMTAGEGLRDHPQPQDSAELFPGAAVVGTLKTATAVRFWTVAYTEGEATETVGGFGVCDGITLSDSNVDVLIVAVSDPSTYHQRTVSRHRPMPAHVFEVRTTSSALMVLVDFRGRKIGFVHDGGQSSRDYVSDSPGFGRLQGLVGECCEAQMRGRKA